MTSTFGRIERIWLDCRRKQVKPLDVFVFRLHKNLWCYLFSVVAMLQHLRHLPVLDRRRNESPRAHSCRNFHLDWGNSPFPLFSHTFLILPCSGVESEASVQSDCHLGRLPTGCISKRSRKQKFVQFILLKPLLLYLLFSISVRWSERQRKGNKCIRLSGLIRDLLFRYL